MNKVIYNISLDVHEIFSQTLIKIRREDNHVQIRATLCEDGKPYSIAEGCTAVFRCKTLTGDVLFNDCEIEDNTIIYDVTSGTTATSGLLECEITLYAPHEAKQITSPRFNIRVDERVYSDSEVESSDEFTALLAAITKVSNLNVTARKSGKTLTITITDKNGTDHAVQVNDGIDVTAVVINAEGHLIVSLSDGSTHDAGMARGRDGSDRVLFGTTAQWNTASQTIAQTNTMYVYTDHMTDAGGHKIAGYKIGDGTSYLIDMPFNDHLLYEHINDSTIHITSTERAFWNNKIRCDDSLSGENLILTRN